MSNFGEVDKIIKITIPRIALSGRHTTGPRESHFKNI
jgi:hypothetical protein